MLNKVILIGKLGFDPEIKKFNNGGEICVLKLITINRYKNKNDEKSLINDWHRIILYKNLANYSKNFLNKGDIVFIEGRIQTRRWLTEEKSYNYITEIIAKEIKLIKSYNNKTYSYKDNSLNYTKSVNKNFINESKKNKNNYNIKNDNETDLFDLSESNIFDKTNSISKISKEEILSSNNNEIDFDDLESEDK